MLCQQELVSTATAGVQTLQEKASQLETVEKTLQDLAEVRDWKERVQHVNKCAAWSDVYVSEAELARLQNKLSMRIPDARKEVSSPSRPRTGELFLVPGGLGQSFIRH